MNLVSFCLTSSAVGSISTTTEEVAAGEEVERTRGYAIDVYEDDDKLQKQRRVQSTWSV